MITFSDENVNKPHKTWDKRRLRRLYVEMMGLIGAGNNPMVGMTVAVAVAVEEAMK